MAATDKRLGLVALAALALPGVTASTAARADAAPDTGVVSLKMSRYEDWQPGLKRITVNSPSVYALVPINSRWAVEGSGVLDSVSGASPRWHSAVSGASRMTEERKAADFKVMRYFDRSSYGFGLSRSSEHDYTSNAMALEGRWSSDDNNTTLNAGVGLSSDRIHPHLPSIDESRRTTELAVGLTRAMTRLDLVQVNLTRSYARGYLNDPYKLADTRPDSRDQTALLARWNHHLEGWGQTLKGSYRFYSDSFGIRAHTFTGEWVVPLTASVRLTPLLRYGTQRAASFYFDPNTGVGVAPDIPGTTYHSADARLSAYGALTLGARIDWRIDPRWSMDWRFDRYEQRASWRIGGKGSPGLNPLSAYFAQWGMSYRF